MSLSSSNELMLQVQEKRKLLLKKAAENGTPADPTNNGVTAIPRDANANDPNKTGAPNSNTLPESGSPTDSKILETTKPSPSGEGHVPSTTDGNAIDASGTDKLKEAAMASSGQFASKWQALMANAKQAASGAPAAAAAPAAATPAGSPQENQEAIKKADALFASVGAMVLANEEGQRLVTDLITKQASAQQAQLMLHEAAVATDVYAKQAAYLQAVEEERAKQAAAVAAQFEALPPAEREVLTKLATFQQADSALFTEPTDAFYWTKGAGAAMAAMDGMPGGEGGAPGGEMGPMPGGDGTPTPEDAVEILQQLVQQGIITPDQAQQLLEQLTQEFQGGAPGGDGAAPEAQTPPSEEEKAASALLKAAGVAS